MLSSSRSLREELQVVKPSRRAAAIERRHSWNKSHDSGISGLPHPLSRKDTPNDFDEDADQFVSRRRDSTGAELYNKPQLSRSLSLDRCELTSLGRTLSPNKFRSNLHVRPQTYYPLHRGPSITVSSADGTSLRVDSESDTQRNAAAQCLFRAITRHNTEQRLKTLDVHMDKIFGSVELDLEIKDVNALNCVKVSDYNWDIKSTHMVIEGGNEKKTRKRVRKMRDAWDRLVTKIFR